MAQMDCGTDFSTSCGEMPRSLLQMLAACMVKAECAFDGQVFLNTVGPPDSGCDALEPFWTCDNQGITDEQAERAMVENLFALDECGNLALKIYKGIGSV